MKRIKAVLVMMLSLAIVVNLNVGLHSMTAKADTIEDNITVVAKVMNHRSQAVENAEITLSKFDGEDWKKVDVSLSDKDGEVSFELSSESNVNSYFKLVVTKAPTGYLIPEDAAIYVFAADSDSVSYSKSFNTSTNTLGDGATAKIKSFRLSTE